MLEHITESIHQSHGYSMASLSPLQPQNITNRYNTIGTDASLPQLDSLRVSLSLAVVSCILTCTSLPHSLWISFSHRPEHVTCKNHGLSQWASTAMTRPPFGAWHLVTAPSMHAYAFCSVCGKSKACTVLVLHLFGVV